MPRGAGLEDFRSDVGTDVGDTGRRRVGWISRAARNRQSRSAVHLCPRRTAVAGAAGIPGSRNAAGSRAASRGQAGRRIRGDGRARVGTAETHRRIRAARRPRRRSRAITVDGIGSVVSRRRAHAAAPGTNRDNRADRSRRCQRRRCAAYPPAVNASIPRRSSALAYTGRIMRKRRSPASDAASAPKIPHAMPTAQQRNTNPKPMTIAGRREQAALSAVLRV